MKRLLASAAIVAIAAIGVPLATATTAVAGGGNSGAAKACQKGGWQHLVRADGTAFTSEEDCVSYAAQGGVFGQPGQGCLDGTGSNPDARLTGPLNTLNNLTGYDSFGGTCAGAAFANQVTVVTAGSGTEAATNCNATTNGLDPLAIQMDTDYPSVPATWWVCQPVI
jgi:hypothetical protein